MGTVTSVTGFVRIWTQKFSTPPTFDHRRLPNPLIAHLRYWMLLLQCFSEVRMLIITPAHQTLAWPSLWAMKSEKTLWFRRRCSMSLECMNRDFSCTWDDKRRLLRCLCLWSVEAGSVCCEDKRRLRWVVGGWRACSRRLRSLVRRQRFPAHQRGESRDAAVMHVGWNLRQVATCAVCHTHYLFEPMCNCWSSVLLKF